MLDGTGRVELSDMPSKMLVPICALGLVAACSTTRPFDRTLDALSESRFEWRPIADADAFYQLSPEQYARVDNDINQCVRERSDLDIGSYNREERALEIVECMHRKGWTPVQEIGRAHV